jgi:hypothetical protein
VGEAAGLAIYGKTFAGIGIEKAVSGLQVVRYAKSSAEPGSAIKRTVGPPLPNGIVWLRLSVAPRTVEVGPPGFTPYWPSMLREEHADVTLAFSLDGKVYTALGEPFMTQPGLWVGARIGLFANAPYGTPSATATVNGAADFDFFRVTAAATP